MAQQVSPFVIVWSVGGYCVGVEKRGYHPDLLDPSIYKLLEKEGKYSGKSKNKELVCEVVDWLNNLVKEGFITLNEHGIWEY